MRVAPSRAETSRGPSRVRVRVRGKGSWSLLVRKVGHIRAGLACRRLRGCRWPCSIPIGMYTMGMTDRPNAHDALLGATSDLTYECGITGTGVDAIAARAGVTKRT